ncbi:NAD-dependent deacylase [Agromyces protaetiae]|uniref:NAD-dependent deacylase n=1 Tax=Agromyces protaetiae TaxID=2509455 RepID=UPI001FB832A5|nr:NAD-dependent deacylase [Agromyces protaetiae]
MRITVLTGAGISAESGVPTFRDAGGLWEGHRVEDVATPEGFRRDPGLVQRFYDARRAGVASAVPNAAHLALARLEADLGDDLLVVTQNIDDLHERAGSTRVVHMHGRLGTALCRACGARSVVEPSRALADDDTCPECWVAALRPDVVWFGEVPYDLDLIDDALAATDRFVAIGTSGAVYPAAGFVLTAAGRGAATLELNLVESEVSLLFDEVRHGLASMLVPAWVDEVLSAG